MPSPTDEQVRDYAAKLPDIYRDILAVFPGASPQRRFGDGLTLETIHETVETAFPDYRVDDVRDALERLVETVFLSRDRSGIMLYPTDVGERLIAAVTGRVAPKRGIPDLPLPTWG